MPTDQTRLKNAIIAAKEDGEQTDSAAAWERFATKLAAAIIVEIKALKINYTAGLTAPNGAVGGAINHTVS